MTYRILSPALTEIAESAEFYDGQVAGLGADFIEEVDDTIARILRFPEAWGRISAGYRHCSLRRFPYTVVYATAGADEILVVSVFHQSRAPLSWKHNL